jgi:hypothetical protein
MVCRSRIATRGSGVMHFMNSTAANAGSEAIEWTRGPLPEVPLQIPNDAPTAYEQATAGRDRLEIVEFATAEAQRQAIGALVEYGMLNFTSYRDREWLVRTPVARKLRALGVPFAWLTERA